MINFDGKVVLLTGASRGIGAAIAKVLSAAGAALILHCATRRDAAERLAAGLPGPSAIVAADLAAEDGAAALWRAALAWRGRIDVLVNNAGIYEPAPMFGDDDGAWRRAWSRALQVNLVAAAELGRSAIRHFKERGGGGVIVNVASRAAFRGDAQDYANYAASKGGMIAMTRTHARAHARDGILVYAVAPGFVRTEMAEESFRHGIDEAAVKAEIPIGDIATVEDVANVVAFLASGLAPHATGTTVDVNGASYVR